MCYFQSQLHRVHTSQTVDALQEHILCTHYEPVQHSNEKKIGERKINGQMIALNCTADNPSIQAVSNATARMLDFLQTCEDNGHEIETRGIRCEPSSIKYRFNRLIIPKNSGPFLIKCDRFEILRLFLIELAECYIPADNQMRNIFDDIIKMTFSFTNFRAIFREISNV